MTEVLQGAVKGKIYCAAGIRQAARNDTGTTRNPGSPSVDQTHQEVTEADNGDGFGNKKRNAYPGRPAQFVPGSAQIHIQYPLN